MLLSAANWCSRIKECLGAAALFINRVSCCVSCEGGAPHSRVCFPPHVPGGGASRWHASPQPMWNRQCLPKVAVHTLPCSVMRLKWVLCVRHALQRASLASRHSAICGPASTHDCPEELGSALVAGICVAKQRVWGCAMFLMSFYCISMDWPWV